MLTKSAAKTFFLGGTALTGAAFVLLTLDTLKQFPERTNDEQITEEVRHGLEIWTNNNCMGCHTLLGEGAYYAPELTRVVERRGEDWIRAFLKDPQSFYPGRRKMVKYDFFDPALDPDAESNITDVIEFFKWVQLMDLNGFPPEPDLAAPMGLSTPAQAATLDSDEAAPVDEGAEAERPASVVSDSAAPPIFTSVCLGCHIHDGAGGNVGPALDDIASRMSAEEISAFIADPASVREGTTMPNLALDEEVVTSITNFLIQE